MLRFSLTLAAGLQAKVNTRVVELIVMMHIIKHIDDAYVSTYMCKKPFGVVGGKVIFNYQMLINCISALTVSTITIFVFSALCNLQAPIRWKSRALNIYFSKTIL